MNHRPAVIRPAAIAAYTGMVLAAVGLFLATSHYGEMLTAPAAPVRTAVSASSGGAVSAEEALWHVLLALTAVVVVGRLLGSLLQSLGQPPVVGEVVAGIVLGPSVLGRAAPGASAYILPPSVAPSLGVVAQLGVVLYMFLIGLELNIDLVRKRAHATVATSHASIIAPFVLGSLLALYLYPRLSTSDVSFTSFALFMGVAMSITAFPVLARILTDRGMSRTDLGIVALTCAAVDDVTAWCLLAFVVGATRSGIQSAMWVTLLTFGFIGAMFLVVRPFVARLVARTGDRVPTREAIVLTLAGLLLSALTTEAIGIHAIFGAFLFGVVVPHDSALARTLTDRMMDFVTILLLPAFFAFTGMRTRVDLIAGYQQWLMCGLLVLVATTGKFGGTFVAARMAGMDGRLAAGLGILMNTRGLMQLIVLNVGLDLGVISPTLFAMMVLMALATTIATTPLLDLFHRGSAVRLSYNRPALR